MKKEEGKNKEKRKEKKNENRNKIKRKVRWINRHAYDSERGWNRTFMFQKQGSHVLSQTGLMPPHDAYLI
jgi:hypothetical protein